MKKINEVEERLNSMWDFKTEYKRNLSKKNRGIGIGNLPALIPEEMKEYYRDRTDQTTQQRNIQDKIVDVLAFLDDPDNKSTIHSTGVM